MRARWDRTRLRRRRRSPPPRLLLELWDRHRHCWPLAVSLATWWSCTMRCLLRRASSCWFCCCPFYFCFVLKTLWMRCIEKRGRQMFATKTKRQVERREMERERECACASQSWCDTIYTYAILSSFHLTTKIKREAEIKNKKRRRREQKNKERNFFRQNLCLVDTAEHIIIWITQCYIHIYIFDSEDEKVGKEKERKRESNNNNNHHKNSWLRM